MRKLLIAATMAFGALAAVPASALTFNVADFGAPFSYAQYNGGTSFTPFTTSCGFGSACVAGPEGAGNSQVVYDAGSFLVAHPGTSANTAVLFTAPLSGTYSFNVTAALADLRPEAVSGNGVTLAGYANGFFVPVGTLVGPGSSQNFTGSLLLTAGQQIGLIIGNNGGNAYDSTSLAGTVSSAVPEPATWAMMIGGVGAVGGTLRRRRSKGAARLAHA